MKHRQHGMTLVELLTAMVILAILVGLAVPSFRQFAADSRAQAASSDLTTALAVARSEAVRRSARAVACSTTDSATCSGSTDWATGWLVFSDANGNNNFDAGDTLVQVWPALHPGMLTATSSQARAVYSPMGMAVLPVGAPSVTFTITPASCVGDRIRRTVMVLSGSLQNTRLPCPP